MAHAFDTNVVLYLTGTDTRKQAISRGLLQKPGIVSVQVLNECVAVLRSSRRGRTPASWAKIDLLLAGLVRHHRIVGIDLATHGQARTYAERHKLPTYDALIVAAAVIAKCTVLWTEDMHDGLVIDGLTIRNPYSPSP